MPRCCRVNARHTSELRHQSNAGLNSRTLRRIVEWRMPIRRSPIRLSVLQFRIEQSRSPHRTVWKSEESGVKVQFSPNQLSLMGSRFLHTRT